MNDGLKSRKTRVFIITGIIGLIGQLVGLPTGVVGWLTQIAAGYIAGQAAADFGAQGAIPSGHPAKKNSIKFLAYMVTSIIVAAGGYFEMPPEVLEWATNLVTVFLVGQGIADAGKQGLRKIDESIYPEFLPAPVNSFVGPVSAKSKPAPRKRPTKKRTSRS